MSDYKPADADMLQKEAHQVYLDNWETKTQFAENDCKWTPEIHHRTHQAIQDLSSTVDLLATFLSDAMTRIDQLEAIIKDQK